MPSRSGALSPSASAGAEFARRLGRVQDLLDQVQRMLIAEAPCPLVLRQLYAARCELRQAKARYLRACLEACLAALEQAPEPRQCEALMSNLCQLFRCGGAEVLRLEGSPNEHVSPIA